MVKLGRYNLVRRVGTGGMAEIWKAKVQGPAGFEKIVAIKRVLPHLAADTEFTDMFIEEAKLVARLVHPNIVQVFDFGLVENADGSEERKDYYIAMEYIAGQNLAAVLKRLADKKAKLPIELALFAGAEAARGLAFAHSETDSSGRPLQIVHRDVSPHNVMVSYRGEVKVTDFGIAKVASALPRTAMGVWKGKISYMSPEQVSLKGLDKRSDVFSLGLVLYELVTGTRLFGGSSAEEIYAKITTFDPMKAPIADLPDPVREILQSALAVDADKRYQDATNMESALTWALGPGGSIQARNAFAGLMTECFLKEHKVELSETDQIEEGTQQVVSKSEQSALTLSPKAAAGGAPAKSLPLKSDTNVDPWMRDIVAAENAPEIRTTVGGRDAGGGIAAAIAPSLPPPNAPDRESGTQVRADYAHTMVSGGPPLRPADKTQPLRAVEKNRGRKGWLFGVGALFALFGAAVIGAFAGPSFFRPEPAATPIRVATVAVAQASVPAPAATPAHATPRVERTAVAMVTREPRAPPVSTPQGTPTAARVVAARGTGKLSVFADPWVEVWVDGVKVTAETPLVRHKLSAGKHALRFTKPDKGLRIDKSVEILADREIRIDIDVAAQTLKITPQ